MSSVKCSAIRGLILPSGQDGVGRVAAAAAGLGVSGGIGAVCCLGVKWSTKELVDIYFSNFKGH